MLKEILCRTQEKLISAGAARTLHLCPFLQLKVDGQGKWEDGVRALRGRWRWRWRWSVWSDEVTSTTEVMVLLSPITQEVLRFIVGSGVQWLHSECC